MSKVYSSRLHELTRPTKSKPTEFKQQRATDYGNVLPKKQFWNYVTSISDEFNILLANYFGG